MVYAYLQGAQDGGAKRLVDESGALQKAQAHRPSVPLLAEY
jgi:hypothetical protein